MVTFGGGGRENIKLQVELQSILAFCPCKGSFSAASDYFVIIQSYLQSFYLLKKKKTFFKCAYSLEEDNQQNREIQFKNKSDPKWILKTITILAPQTPSQNSSYLPSLLNLSFLQIFIGPLPYDRRCYRFKGAREKNVTVSCFRIGSLGDLHFSLKTCCRF